MADALHQVFAWVCGQAADHTWSPGGVPLPFCQRCTGLYAGAALGAIAHLLIPLRAPYALRWAYGLCLLQMIPFGLHWVGQGPILRTVSGAVFAFGLTGFLAARPNAALGRAAAPTPRRLAALALIGLAGAAAITGSAARGGAAAARVLAGLGLAGLLALAGLVAGNLLATLRRAPPRRPGGAP